MMPGWIALKQKLIKPINFFQKSDHTFTLFFINFSVKILLFKQR